MSIIHRKSPTCLLMVLQSSTSHAHEQYHDHIVLITHMVRKSSVPTRCEESLKTCELMIRVCIFAAPHHDLVSQGPSETLRCSSACTWWPHQWIWFDPAQGSRCCGVLKACPCPYVTQYTSATLSYITSTSRDMMTHAWHCCLGYWSRNRKLCRDNVSRCALWCTHRHLAAIVLHLHDALTCGQRPHSVTVDTPEAQNLASSWDLLVRIICLYCHSLQFQDALVDGLDGEMRAKLARPHGERHMLEQGSDFSKHAEMLFKHESGQTSQQAT